MEKILYADAASNLFGRQTAFTKAGNESPAFDAICLFEHVFHMNRQDLMLHGNTKQATLEQETEFFSLIEQRAKKRPLQYILGEWPFLDFHLKMGEGVLIAREDTTVLVETAAKLIQTKQATILDLCAGTGAVGLGIASLLSTAHVTCVEKYAPAFAYLQQNIALCKEQGIENVVALQGDILSEAFASAFQDIDTIVSNPPYIETAVLPTIAGRSAKRTNNPHWMAVKTACCFTVQLRIFGFLK